ncbi:MAG TPA: sigma-70 family RNA polymerase sigma factor [Rhodocyclaceae bacterium]|nr:sigma-70 family RNA polymerase sigma factor [Rhodocyclaceae bacterium]
MTSERPGDAGSCGPPGVAASAALAPAGSAPASAADDRAFFCAQIERLTDRLYGTALRLARNRADAEDLVSEAVVKAWACRHQLHDRACFEKWILRILTNAFFSQCRRVREASLDARADDAHEADGDEGFEPFSLFDRLYQPFLLWWGNPEQELLHKLLREDLDAALDALPEHYRLVVILVELQGYSYAEAAETLAVPVGTVRSRLNRARSALQRALWEQALAAGLVHDTPAREPPHD